MKTSSTDSPVCELQTHRREAGFALVTALFLIIVMASMLGAYTVLTRNELALAKASRDSASGFNAAEAGLNIRASAIKQKFQGYDLPVGTPPDGIEDCDAGTLGTGDFACQTHDFDNNHSVTTYVTELAGNPIATVVPAGEPFAGLSASDFRYTVSAVGRNQAGSNEAILDLTFKSRRVPLFQFAVFFEEDLEFFNGATMSISGPIHTNGDGYFAAQDGGQTNLGGQVTLAGNLYRGLKSVSSCGGYSGTVSVYNPTTLAALPGCSSSRATVSSVSSWNNNLMVDVPSVEVPPLEEMDAFSDGAYWQSADVRIVLRLNSSGLPNTTNSTTGVEVVGTNGVNIPSATNALHSAANCPGLVQTGSSGSLLSVGTQGPGTSGNQLRQYREYQYSSTTNEYQRTLEIDMRALLNCMHAYPVILGNRALSDTTQGGLVFYFGIDGPNDSATHNNYAVRIRNAATLQATTSGAPAVRGLTVVSDQGVNLWGNYNSSGWIPAAIMADTTYLLSTGWSDSDSYLSSVWDRDGLTTTVQAAIVTGIRRTGGVNGVGGQDQGADSNGGGLINFFRFNEWFRCDSSCSGTPNFTYVGSIVSLGAPRRSQSTWGPFTYYSAPNRVWSYDTRFNDPANLPPMTPQMVYLKQELFVRDYELDS